MPEHLLELARQVLSRIVDPRRATREADSAHNRLDALGPLHNDWVAVAAGSCANAALFCALYDETFDPNDLDLDARDEDAQPEERDSSFLAAFACSGGAPWDPKSNREARRIFWLWWLAEAVPAAARATI